MIFGVYDGILRLGCWLFGMALGGVVVLMGLDVLLRGAALGSLPWVIELTEYLLYGGTFLAAPWVLRQGAHVRVDILLVSLPRWAAIRLEQFIDLCGFGIALVLAYFGAVSVGDAYRDHMMQFKTWTVPESLLLLPIPIAGVLLSIEFALRFLRVQGVVAETYSIIDRPSI